MRRIIILICGLMVLCKVFAQSAEKIGFTETDTIPSGEIHFTTMSASEYISDLLEKDNLWRSEGDTMRLSLLRLINHFNEPFDSVQSRLSGFQYDSVRLYQAEIVQNDTLPLRWLNDSTLIIDTVAMEKEPFIIQKTIIKKVIDTIAVAGTDSISEEGARSDSLLIWWEAILHDQGSDIIEYDTLTSINIDSVYLVSKGIRMYQFINNRIVPPLIPPGSNKTAWFLPDSGKLVVSDTLRPIVADSKSPFYLVPGENMPDSLKYAVETILSHTVARDSILLHINNIQGQKTPFWLTTGRDDLYRYWVKNFKNDSITIWMGNPNKNDITLILEEDIDVNRMTKEVVVDVPITRAKPDMSLAKVEPLKEIPVYWNYNFSSSFTLNQTYLSNWAKGGENSLSSLLDIKGTAKYINDETNSDWTSSGRIKYGAIISEEHGFRTNTDMLELNSQYNKDLKKKIDFSAVFYFKTQIANGFKYPNDSVVVSKFLNPGTFTIGMGLEYKPFKKTTLNFSALSYKNTFVLDTAGIEQSAHGVANDKRARQEMGGQLVAKNSIDILDDINMTNSVRLFSNYLNEPGNIDVDWEVNLEKRINWYFTIHLNLHMIYDDDIRFPVMDENDQPVKLPDGSTKKVAKMQFKQFLGLSFLFKF